MDNLKHSPEFDLAYRFITETNLNVFLTGKAGTGKTTFLKYLRQNSFKKMVVAAPTGVAAINAGGVTLHSLFQLPFAPFIPTKETNEQAINSNSLLSQARLSGAKLSLLRNLELLVIDEVSMVASHTIDAIDTILKSVRRRHRQPFGGVQVLFIGDLHQLQPVVKNNEWQFLQEYYSSIFFFDSLILREHPPQTIELKEIFRQKDQSFVNILNEIRNNSLTRDNFDLLNTRLNRNYFPDDNDGYIALTTHVRQAEDINRRKLHNLKAASKIYKAEISGDYPEQLYPAEAQLELKEGAQIMFLKNDNEGRKYFNGKLGIITKLGDSAITVKCKGEPDIDVRKHEWKNINYKLNKTTREITEDYLGSFIQFPLRLAWGITIHKSQGLTFEKVVIDSANAFANGQVYVALSRCTSLEGLILTSPINQQFLGAHQNLEEWKRGNHHENNLQERFDESRRHYLVEELQNIFTWNKWSDELQELNTAIYRLKDDLPAISFSWIKQLTETQKELQQTADKFKEWMLVQYKDNVDPEVNQALQTRLKNAAVYFSAEMVKWKQAFRNHSLTTDTKKASTVIDASLDEINGTVQELLHKIDFCKNGFRLEEYLKYGRKLSVPVEKIQSSYEGQQAGKAPVGELVHQGLYHRIAGMRKRIVEEGERKLPLYMVFSSDAIRNVCSHLPGDKDALMKVKGFGKTKVGKYGDEVIELVLDYCHQHNIEPNYHIESKPKVRKPGERFRPVVSETAMETLRLFREGKSAGQIAMERNLSVSTIEGHLAQGISNALLNIDQVMNMDEVNTIAEYFPEDLENVRLGEIKAKAPADITYGKLTMILAWLKQKNAN